MRTFLDIIKVDDQVVVSFYDVTTLYFESESEDDLRRIGFSKEGKLARPQIQLGLFTTLEGYPLSYEVYDGKKYEGHTLLEALINFQKRFQLKNKPIVVADRGMLNDANIAFLENNGYKYILGAKIKMLPTTIKEKIENLTFIDDSVTHQININKTIKYTTDDKKHSLDISQRLILSFSSSRAKKDKHDREKAIAKLKKRLEDSKSVKSQLSNNGYKKYLQLQSSDKNSSCDLSITLNEDKILEDEAWDGLKGIVTNNETLSSEELIHQYSNLWQVEESFRITKHDLKIRPIYHWKPSRVKAHLAISFMAYTLVRYLEYRVRLQYKKLSPEKIRQILLSVQTSILYDTTTDKKFAMPSKVSDDAKKIYKLMGVPIATKPSILK